MKQDMSIRYARLLEHEETQVIIEEQMSSQEGEQLFADDENVELERNTPQNARRKHIRQDMSVHYKHLLDEQEQEDATTAKKPSVGDNSIES